MGSAFMNCVIKEVKFPSGQPDVDCTVWSGILDFAASNGSYAASHPFENLVVAPGDIVPVGALIYDGIGGFCVSGTADLYFRVTVAGADSAANIVAGSFFARRPRPATPAGHTVAIDYHVPVTVTNSGTGAAATKWFVFTVITVC